jgi:hypothetical protein
MRVGRLLLIVGLIIVVLALAVGGYVFFLGGGGGETAPEPLELEPSPIPEHLPRSRSRKSSWRPKISRVAP